MAAPTSTTAADTSGWEKFVDDDAKTPYYYNKRTGESSWEMPEGFVEKEADNNEKDASKQPPKWRKFVDEGTGTPYFYDEANESTQWEEPEGFVESVSDDESEDDEAADEESEDEERAPVREAPVQAEPHTSHQPPQEDEKPASSNSDDDKGEDQAAASITPVTSDTTTAEQGESVLEPSANAEVKWVKHIDRASGKPYYHDTVSNKTQWEEPAGFEDSAPPMSAAAAEYQAHLNRVRTERLTRVTQQVLDPTGSLGRLNALLSGISPSGGADDAGETEQDDENGSGPAARKSKTEWQQHVDPHTQRFYYHNVVTGETQWQKPDAPVVSGLADWVPPEVSNPVQDAASRKTVSGVNYAARAKFNRLTGKYEQFGGDEYWQTQGVAPDRAGRQMSHFFDMTDLEKNREEAKVLKEKLKRKNIDWKKVAAEKKAKKQKQKNEWMFQD